MKPQYYRSVSSKDAGRPRLTHHHKGGWNETKWMRWVWRNGGMKCVVGENGRKPVKNNTQTPFRPPRKTHMEGPRRELGTPAVGGERLTACATRDQKAFATFPLLSGRKSNWSLRTYTDPFAFRTVFQRLWDQKISMWCFLILRKLHRTRKIFLKIILRPYNIKLLM